MPSPVHFSVLVVSCNTWLLHLSREIAAVGGALERLTKLLREMREPSHSYGDLAQMVERSLSMREALGSMPRFSSLLAGARGLLL